MTTLTEQAQTALQSGDRNLALQLLQKNLGQNPRDIDAWLLLAWTVNTPEKKRECYRRVLRIDPKNSDAQAGLAALDNPEAGSHSTLPPLAHPHPDVIPDADVDPQDESLIQWPSSTPAQTPKPAAMSEQATAPAEDDAEPPAAEPQFEVDLDAGGTANADPAEKPMRLDAALAMAKAAPKSKSKKKSPRAVIPPRVVIPRLVSVPSWLIATIAVFWILVLVIPLSLAASRVMLGNGKFVTTLETMPTTGIESDPMAVQAAELLSTEDPAHKDSVLIPELDRPMSTVSLPTPEPVQPTPEPSQTPTQAPTVAPPTAVIPTAAPTSTVVQATAVPTLGSFDGLPSGLVPGGWWIENMVAPTDVEGPAPINQMYLFPDGTFLFLGWGKYTRVDEQTLSGCGRYQDLDNWNFCFTLKLLSVMDREVEINLSLNFPNHAESNAVVNGKMLYKLPDTSTGIVYPAFVGRWDIAGSQAFSGTAMDLHEDRSASLIDGSASKDLGTYTINDGIFQLDRYNVFWWRVHSLGSLLFLEGGNDTSGVIILRRTATQ
jgi:hypothetical protein